MLNRKLDAKQDFQTALSLVDLNRDEDLKSTIEMALKPL